MSVESLKQNLDDGYEGSFYDDETGPVNAKPESFFEVKKVKISRNTYKDFKHDITIEEVLSCVKDYPDFDEKFIRDNF